MPASSESMSVTLIPPRVSASASCVKRALARKQIICDIMGRIVPGRPVCGPAGHLDDRVGGYDHGVPASLLHPRPDGRVRCRRHKGAADLRCHAGVALFPGGPWCGRLGRFQPLMCRVRCVENVGVDGCDTSQHECSSCGMCYYNERRPSRHL